MHKDKKPNAVFLAKARIQIVPSCEASEFDAFGRVYELDSGFRQNDGLGLLICVHL